MKTAERAAAEIKSCVTFAKKCLDGCNVVDTARSLLDTIRKDAEIIEGELATRQERIDELAGKDIN